MKKITIFFWLSFTFVVKSDKIISIVWLVMSSHVNSNRTCIQVLCKLAIFSGSGERTNSIANGETIISRFSRFIKGGQDKWLDK